MSIFLDLAVLLGGVLSFLFFFWRRLKEDYSSSLIFSAGFLFIFSILVGSGAGIFITNHIIKRSYFFEPQALWFWGSFVGFLVALVIAKRRFKFKIIEVFEAGILGAAAWILFVYLRNVSWIFIIITCALLLLFYFFEARYRGFGWYKSGRVGFSGLAVSGLFFTVRMILSLVSPQLFSLVGKLDLVFSGVAAFLLFFSLYNLAEDV